MPDRALEGVRVIEFGDFISAPFTAKLMADLGAEVIKIEEPKVGDESRRFGPFPGDIPHLEKSGLYAYLNSNKHSIPLNPRVATGADVFKELLKSADILVENQQPNVMKDLGLDYDTVGKVNPNLLMTSITTFGRTGPYKDYKGYDLTAWQGSGSGHRYLGYPDREPLRAAWYLASHWAAISAATATSLALYARDVVGSGQHIDVSSTDCLATILMGYQLVTLYHMKGETEVRKGHAMGNMTPAGMFPCKDGYVYMMALEPHQWDGLVKAMGEPDWAKAPMFAGPAWNRLQYQDEIYALMQPWLDSHTKEEIFAACQANRVPSGPVYNPKDLLENQHLNERGFFAETDHPMLGHLKMLGAPYKLSETPWSLRTPAPLLGQHNEEVFCGTLGFSKVDLVDLRRTGVI